MRFINKPINLILLMFVSVVKATNDSIVKVSRKIPENYKEAYTSSDYNYQEQEPSFWLEFKLWLAQLIYNLYKKLGLGGTSIYYTKLVFYTLIIIGAIYIIARMIFYKEGTWLFRKKQNNNLTYQNEVEEIESANFDILVKEALAQTNYRLAVKYYYLWVLQKLSEKEIIELSNLKTNADYQLETEDTSYNTHFKSVSYYYNYIWYGEFVIDQEAYQKIEISYQQLLKDLA